MRAISCGVSSGKVCSCRGNAATRNGLPSALFPLVVSAPIWASHRSTSRLLARLLAVRAIWRGIIIARCNDDVASASRLRFSPLEVFAQCQLQPILPRIFGRGSGLPLELILLILHRAPVRVARSSSGSTGRITICALRAFATADPGGGGISLCRLRRYCDLMASLPAEHAAG